MTHDDAAADTQSAKTISRAVLQLRPSPSGWRWWYRRQDGQQEQEQGNDKSINQGNDKSKGESIGKDCDEPLTRVTTRTVARTLTRLMRRPKIRVITDAGVRTASVRRERVKREPRRLRAPNAIRAQSPRPVKVVGSSAIPKEQAIDTTWSRSIFSRRPRRFNSLRPTATATVICFPPMLSTVHAMYPTGALGSLINSDPSLEGPQTFAKT